MNPNMNRYTLYSLRHWYFAHLYQDDLNWGLQRACELGDKDLVEWMIESGANHWNRGLEQSCLSGHRDIVELMIEKGSNDWNWGLYEACHGGHRELAKLMIKKGADHLNWALEGACLGKHRDLARWIIELGADTDSCCLLTPHCHPISVALRPHQNNQIHKTKN